MNSCVSNLSHFVIARCVCGRSLTSTCIPKHDYGTRHGSSSTCVRKPNIDRPQLEPFFSVFQYFFDRDTRDASLTLPLAGRVTDGTTHGKTVLTRKTHDTFIRISSCEAF